MCGWSPWPTNNPENPDLVGAVGVFACVPFEKSMVLHMRGVQAKKLRIMSHLVGVPYKNFGWLHSLEVCHLKIYG